MKNLLAVAITLLFFGMIIFPSSGIQIQNKSVITSNRGNTIYVGGSGPGNYTSIQDAIDDALDGDTVFVYDDSSPYFEWSILINKSINLIGEDKNTTNLSGQGNSVHIFDVLKDEVNINGFSIMNCAYSGIYVDTANNIKISDNHFYNCNNGIFFFDVNYASIISNSFEHCREGAIFIYGDYWCYNLTISDNFILGRANEIWLSEITFCTSGKNIKITNNTLIGDGESDFGLSVYIDSGFRIDDSIIDGNIFRGFTYSGVEINGDNNKFSHNNFINNNDGLTICDNDNKVINNNFINNNGGLVAYGKNNRIINNNFMNNTDDIYGWYFSNNRLDGNYWDKWIGFKYKLPIFQRFPMIIFGFLAFNIDWHPAKEPYVI